MMKSKLQNLVEENNDTFEQTFNIVEEAAKYVKKLDLDKEEKHMITVRSTLPGAVNEYLQSIKDIRIQCYPETEIIEIDSNVKNIVLDTLSSTYSRTRSGLAKAERNVMASIYGVRDRVSVGLRDSGDTISFGTMAGMAAYIVTNNIEVFDGYEDLAINHLDLSGNENVRGYTNNRLYNLELCTDSENKVHAACLRSLEELYPGHRFAISAKDTELIEVLRFGANANTASAKEFRSKYLGYRFMHDDYKRQYMDSIADTGEYDKYGTLYIGNAGSTLKQWKKYWNDMLLDVELKKVRCI